jgi:hypothetical protein
MSTWDELELGDLRYHYGEAYAITHPAADTWIAQRRDDRTTLRAENPDTLLRLIRDDYLARPVSRAVAP